MGKLTNMDLNIIYTAIKKSEMNFDNNYILVRACDIAKATKKETKSTAFKNCVPRLSRLSYVSECKHFAQEGIRILFNDNIKEIYGDILKNDFFDLDVAVSLRSRFSKLIYEFLCKSKTNEIKIQELQDYMNIKNPNFTFFARTALNTAAKEFKKTLDFDFKYTLTYSKARNKGRRKTEALLVEPNKFLFKKQFFKILKPYKEDSIKESKAIPKKINKSKQYKTYIMVDFNTGFYKIGKSVNPCIREKTLQSEKPTIEILLSVNDDLELYLHRKYSGKRIRGEWFSLNENDISYIDALFNLHQSNC